MNVGADERKARLPGMLKDLAAELHLTHEALYRHSRACKPMGKLYETAAAS
jgi:hypothetical protein